MNESSLPNQRSFVGSLIATPERPQGMYSQLAHVNWDAKLITDQVCKITLKALELANDDPRYAGEAPTPEFLAKIIVVEGLANSEIDTITAELHKLAGHGGNTLDWLQGTAATLNELHIEDRMKSDFIRKAQNIVTSDIGTANTRWGELAAALDEVRPDFADSQVLDDDGELKLITRLKQEGEDRIARKEVPPYLPYELGKLVEMFDELIPGLLYIVSGLNSTGKSSLLHQIAEGMARGAKLNPDGSQPVIAIFHLEDDHERVIRRAAARLTSASMKELRNGDPRNMMMRAYRMKKGFPGKIKYIHCPGATAAWISQKIAVMKPYAVFIDYAQKLDTTALQKVLGTRAAALSESVEILKRRAESPAHKTIMFLASQEAEYETFKGQVVGRTGTKDSRDIEVKAQGLIRIQAQRVEGEPIVVDGITLAEPGQWSPFVKLVVEKNSDGAGRGGTVECVHVGGRFMFEALSYREWKQTHPGMEYPKPPPAAAPTQEFLDQHHARLTAFDKLNKSGNPLPQEAKPHPKPKPNGKKPAEQSEPPASDEPTVEIPF